MSHLTESQRSIIAGKLATLKVGQVGNGRKVEAQICAPTLEQAADMLNVGRRSVVSAKQVLDAGSREIIEAVETGKLAKLKVGHVKSQREIDGVPIGTPSLEQAADMLNVGRASVARAKQVQSR